LVNKKIILVGPPETGKTTIKKVFFKSILKKNLIVDPHSLDKII